MIQTRSFFPNLRATLVAAASVVASATFAVAQNPNPTVPTPPPVVTTTTDGNNTTTTTTTVDSTGKQVQSVTTSHVFNRGKKKDDKVVPSKETKKNEKKTRMADQLIGVDSKLPDKQLYDKAALAMKKGHFDVARLDLQTMLNTYPDSQYQMRAKLTIADSWYKEGGTAALTQAEQEYRDFCIFFPNAPEAAEAQMRIGDIYFRQMDKPDRDAAKALHAEEEYRRMITDYPDSKLVPQAKQRLREVQEVLATRESDIAAFYATRENWAAVIARYQTVADTFPLYSHLEDTLVGLGDAYAAQSRYIRSIRGLSEGQRVKLLEIYDERAAAAYRKVVLEHSASAHVEDARDRLAAMNLPIPTPTPEQVAASEALENSRRAYKVTDRVRFLVMHEPDTVLTAQLGDPTLTDPKPTTAPAVQARVQGEFASVLHPEAAVAPAAASTTAAPDATTAPTAPAGPAAPLQFKEVGTEDANGTPSTPMTAAPAATTGSGSGVGMEIIASPTVRAATQSTMPAATGAPDPNGGLKAVGPANAGALPPIEAAGPAPDRPNTITGPTPAAAVAPLKGKAKPEFDKADESSSKHKKKKGIKKIIPLVK